jgi:AcrR family transcriptional regulator
VVDAAGEPVGESAPRARQSRSEDTRMLILEAAVACLAEEGYAAATTLRIQARAGVSRGRLLHHFPSRDALLVAAAQHLASVRMAETEQWVAMSIEGRLTGAERVDHATEVLWQALRQPYFWASMELWIAARTNPELRECLRPEEHRLGAAVRQVIATTFGPAIAGHPRFPEVRDLLFTSMRGVALTYSFEDRDPDLDRHLPLWKGIAATLLEIERPAGQDGLASRDRPVRSRAV